MPPLALRNRLRNKRHECKHRKRAQKQRRKDPCNRLLLSGRAEDSIEGEPAVVATCRVPLLGVRDGMVLGD